jgi:hypothetical protein
VKDSPAQVWAQHLINQGVAVGPNPTGTAWGIVSGPLPLYPSGTGGRDRFISVQDTGSVQHGKLMPTGERSRHQTVICTLRSPADYNQGWDKCQEIEAKADAIGVTPGLANAPLVTVNGNNYRVTVAHVYIDTVPIGIEEASKRQLFTINIELIPVEVP